VLRRLQGAKVALTGNLLSLGITEQNFGLQKSYTAAEDDLRALDRASRFKQNRNKMGNAPDMLTCRNNGLIVKSFTFFFVASHGFSYLHQQLAAVATVLGSKSKQYAAPATTAAAHNQARTASHNSKFAGPSFSSS
jgi:hypothetical protein